ncbi:MAG: polysaccharide deacetylase family protein, partial [Aliifodinibius sp.]|nr:polysaccharide deacetylase family protein [candidate division Zixibacteria bacterium]NIT56492.1 polysaccharide deacetylase family protein [Fodinibius sp.]NIV11476.1 polysaccharide deacetylase family protein [Fodinibius sp.]NIY25075.1 polysaccharide deacetylase family protein [Fodinibius sp.]
GSHEYHDIPNNPGIRKDPYEFVKAVMGLDHDLQKKIRDKMRAMIGKPESEYRQRWMLNQDEIREMYASNITFGSHGKSHEIFPDMSQEELLAELRDSKAAIESMLNTEVISIAYPNGDYNETIKQTARECGYKIGMATDFDTKGTEYPDILALRRMSINEGAALGPGGRFSKAVFACLLEWFF